MRTSKVRFIVAAIVTFSAYAVYLSRINLSIAIIAMVEDSNNHTSHQQQQQTSHINNSSSPPIVTSSLTGDQSMVLHLPPVAQNVSSNQQHQQEPLAPVFPLKGINSLLIMSREKFDWDQSEQGQIQGAFFFGYILFQIPGARMAESVGAHWIIMVATFGSALISLAFPLSTQLNSIYLLCLLRFVMGLCQSAFFPASYVLFCRWLPEGERSVLLPVMFIGSNIGSISTYIMSAYLIRFNYGWPSVFYLSGLICLVVGGFWAVFGSSGPEDNWLITDEERRFIMNNVNNQSSESNSLYDDDDDEAAYCERQAAAHERDLEAASALTESSECCCATPVEQTTSKEQVDINNNNNNTTTSMLTFRGLGVDNGAMGKSCCQAATIAQRLCKSKSIDSTASSVVTSAEPVFKCNPNHLNHRLSNVTVLTAKHPVTPEPCWPKLLKSVPVWTLILSMYGNEWSNVVLCYELPTYLNTALEYPIERNGVINSFFQFTYAVASPIMSSLGAQMLARRTFGMHKIHVRKMFQSLATFGQMLCFLGIAICGLNVDLIILLMFASIVFRSCANAGDIMVAGDLSPEYAGTIFAFANSVGNTAGFVVPFLAGQFITKAHDHDQWTPFWLTTSCILGASGTIFLIFGETRRQDFSLPATGDVQLGAGVELGGVAVGPTNPHTRRRLSSCGSEGAFAAVGRRRRTSSCGARN